MGVFSQTSTRVDVTGVDGGGTTFKLKVATDDSHDPEIETAYKIVLLVNAALKFDPIPISEVKAASEYQCTKEPGIESACRFAVKAERQYEASPTIAGVGIVPT